MVAKTSNGCHQSEKFIQSDDGSGEILSLGQITNALFEVGGKYRRNM